MQHSKGVYTAWVLLSPAEDVPNAWVAHALDFDVVTQGNNPEHALRMVIEAVGMVLEEDVAAGSDPYARRAPDQHWERLHFILEHGEPLAGKKLLDAVRDFAAGDDCQLAISMFFKESWKPSDDSVPYYRAPLGVASQTAHAHPC